MHDINYRLNETFHVGFTQSWHFKKSSAGQRVLWQEQHSGKHNGCASGGICCRVVQSRWAKLEKKEYSNSPLLFILVAVRNYASGLPQRWLTEPFSHKSSPRSSWPLDNGRPMSLLIRCAICSYYKHCLICQLRINRNMPNLHAKKALASYLINTSLHAPPHLQFHVFHSKVVADTGCYIVTHL